jgi:hypothetical protein
MFRVFGDAEQTPGTPVVWGKNPKNGEDVYLHLRLLPSNLLRDIEKKHGREVHEKAPNGQLVVTYERSVDQTYAVQYEKAAWIWVNSSNLVIEMGDDKAAAFFRDALKDEAIQNGDAVTLDGRINGRVKMFLFQRDQNLALRILAEEGKLRTEAAKEEKALSGN